MKDAIKNTVEMTGGTVDKAIYGGYTVDGKATENRVTLGCFIRNGECRSLRSFVYKQIR